MKHWVWKLCNFFKMSNYWAYCHFYPFSYTLVKKHTFTHISKSKKFVTRKQNWLLSPCLLVEVAAKRNTRLSARHLNNQPSFSSTMKQVFRSYSPVGVWCEWVGESGGASSAVWKYGTVNVSCIDNGYKLWAILLIIMGVLLTIIVFLCFKDHRWALLL